MNRAKGTFLMDFFSNYSLPDTSPQKKRSCFHPNKRFQEVWGSSQEDNIMFEKRKGLSMTPFEHDIGQRPDLEV